MRQVDRETAARNAADDIDALLAQRLTPSAYLGQTPAIQEIAAIISKHFPSAALKDAQPKEDFERPYFCAVRALRHLKDKNHEFIPLECDGCKEIGLFLTEPGYRGDEHNPIGADCERSY